MYDILCAKNAGVRSVLVGWALAVTEEEKTGPEGPDYVIPKAKDLSNMLEL
jgi:phosphoglycolate phosphatase-like HAD superfamily hydrolase